MTRCVNAHVSDPQNCDAAATRVWRVFVCPVVAFLLMFSPLHAAGQSERPSGPIIDSIAVHAYNVFRPAEAASNFVFRIANAVRFSTRPSVVWREILFEVGEPYDSATVAETERNLRNRGIFRHVQIDTLRVDGKLVVSVETHDSWSTQFQFNLRTTGGTATGSIALTETNFLGRGNLASVAYRDEFDRNAVTLQTQLRRVAGTRFTTGILYDDLSDGFIVSWNAGVPFQSLSHRQAVVVTGTNQERRVLRYRNGVVADSAQKRTFQNNFVAAVATRATSRGYTRFGALGQLRREEYVAFQDTGLVIPDSLTGAVGVFADVFHPRFKVVTHYNGFNREEDIDLSTRVSVSAWLAPSGFGYERTGVGPVLTARTGVVMGNVFARLSVRANALLNADGLDSGQVFGTMTIAAKAYEKHTTVLHIEAGARKGQPPALEYDIGHGIGPRAFQPHSFTGNRMVWGIFEHRWFAIDDILGVWGIGFAAFLDYGGAWFDDQGARAGGDIGIGLRLGNSRSSGVNTGRFDLSYRYGDGFTGSRWVFSFGQAFPF